MKSTRATMELDSTSLVRRVCAAASVWSVCGLSRFWILAGMMASACCARKSMASCVKHASQLKTTWTQRNASVTLGHNLHRLSSPVDQVTHRYIETTGSTETGTEADWHHKSNIEQKVLTMLWTSKQLILSVSVCEAACESPHTS